MAVIDNLEIKIKVDSSELEGFKKSASGIGDSLSSSLQKSLGGISLKGSQKSIQNDVDTLASRITDSLTKSFHIDDSMAKKQVHDLSLSLSKEIKKCFEETGRFSNAGVQSSMHKLVDSLMENGKIIEEEVTGYKSRLKDLYDWYNKQDQIRLPKGFGNLAKEKEGVFAGKFSTKKGVDLTGQTALRENFQDLFTDDDLKNQENAVRRLLDLLKEYKMQVETVKPLSVASDGEQAVWETVIREVSEVNKGLKENQQYVDAIKQKAYEVGLSFNYEGTMEQTRKKLQQLENSLSEAKVNAQGKDWEFGTTNFENSIKKIGVLEGKIDALKAKMQSFSAPTDMSDIDAVFERIHAEEKAREEERRLLDAQYEIERATEESTAKVYELGNAYADAAEKAERAKKANKSTEVLGEVEHRKLGDNQQYTQQYKDLVAQLDKANLSLEKLYDRKDKFDNSGASHTTNAFRNLSYDIEKAEEKVTLISNALKRLQYQDKDFEEIGDEIENAGKKSKTFSYNLNAITSSLRAAGFSELARKVGNIGRAFDNVGKSASDAGNGFSSFLKAGGFALALTISVKTLSSALKGVVGVLGYLGKSVASVFGRILSTMGNATKRLLAFGGATKAITRLWNKFAMTFRNRVISKAIMQILKEAKEAINELNAYSQKIGSSFTKNLSALTSHFKYLGRSITAAFAPIINAVTPYIDFLIQKLVGAINVINQFFSALTGSKTWTKAKYEYKQYGDEVDNATDKQKALNKQLQKFDELNNISDNKNDTGSGGNNTSPSGDLFTKEQIENDVESFAKAFKDAWAKADFTEIGEMAAKSIMGVLDGINWDNIQNTAEKLGKSFGTFLNGFFDTQGFSDSVGNAIAGGINAAIALVKGFIDVTEFDTIGTFIGNTVVTALQNIHWDQLEDSGATLGKKMAKGINALLDTDVLAEVSRAVANLLTTGVNAWYDFVGNFDFSKLGTKLGDSINSFFEEFAKADASGKTGWQKLGESISKSIRGIVTSITTAINTIDFVAVGNAIKDMISSIEWGKIVWDLKKCADAIVSGIASALLGREVSVSSIAVGIGAITIATTGAVLTGLLGKALLAAIGSKVAVTLGAGAVEAGIGASTITLGSAVAGLSLKDVFANMVTATVAGFGALKSAIPTGAITLVADAGAIAIAAAGGFSIGKHVAEAIATAVGDYESAEAYKTFKWKDFFGSINATDAKGAFDEALKDIKNSSVAVTVKGAIDSTFDKVRTTFHNFSKDSTGKDVSVATKTAKGNEDSTFTKIKNAFLNFHKDSKGNDVSKAIKTTEGKEGASFTSLKQSYNALGNKSIKITGKGNQSNNSFKNFKKTYNTLKDKDVTFNPKLGADNIQEQLNNRQFAVNVNATARLENCLYINGKKYYLYQEAGFWYWRDENGQANRLMKAEKGGVFNGSYKPISKFANGGIPDHGTQFVAGENGAEVVGHIGRRTEVLNQSQLAATMYTAVLKAMNDANGGGQPTQLFLDGKVVFDSTRNYANDYYRRTGNPAFAI